MQTRELDAALAYLDDFLSHRRERERIPGMVVAVASLFGMRAILVLELAFQRLIKRARPVSEPMPPRYRVQESLRTIRELIGCDILSRPPPVAA